MIVKIQLSQFTTGESRRMLMYDRSRMVQHEAEATPEIIELLGDRPKAYFHAEVIGGELMIDEEAPKQDW